MEIELDEEQLAAVQTCCDLSKRIVAVTGPAGTGKTTIMRIVANKLRDAGYTVALAAPTGKAAKRIFEATGIDASTVHRLLKFSHPGDPDPKTGKPLGVSVPQHNSRDPLPFDVIIVDEYAMVNKDLHRDIIDAMKAGGVVRVFGDIQQLQPIEENKNLEREPSPFQVLLNRFTKVELKTIHRQMGDSGIIKNAHMILRNMIPTSTKDFQIKYTDFPVDALTELLMEGTIDYGSISAQILTTQSTSWIGTAKINTLMQKFTETAHSDRLGKDVRLTYVDMPRYEWAKTKGVRVRVGDKVIQTKNDYDLGVYNGESGVVTDITAFGEIIIDLGDREFVCPPEKEVLYKGNWIRVDPRKNVDLAYAITTHKAQGSEYKNIVYLLNKSTSFMQCRPNFYTAVTRARDGVVVITDQRSMSQSVRRKDSMR